MGMRACPGADMYGGCTGTGCTLIDCQITPKQAREKNCEMLRRKNRREKNDQHATENFSWAEGWILWLVSNL